MKGLGMVTVVAALAAACGSGDARGALGRRAGGAPGTNEPHGEPMPHQQCVGSGGDVTAQDVNGDGQQDIWTVTRDGHVVCRETDANFDGRVDVYRWFDPSGLVTRVEDDYDFDGRIDCVGMYSGGVVQTDTLDTNFDGLTDTWRTYQNGHVTELRRDANGDGQVDTWERYDAQGHVTWAGEDTNHDGRPDSEPDAGAAPPPDPTTVRVTGDGGAVTTAPNSATAATPAAGTQDGGLNAAETPSATPPSADTTPLGPAITPPPASHGSPASPAPRAQKIVRHTP